VTGAWGIEPPSEIGLTATEMMNVMGEKIRAMFIMGENPMISDPDINHVEQQLSKLDFLAVSEMFMSETAALADVVFPACSYAEKNGTFTATDRRIQRVRKAVERLGGSKPDWLIVQELSRRLGYEMWFKGPSEIMDELASVSPIYGGVSFNRLESEDLRWPCTGPTHPGTRILHADSFSRGKGKFNAVEYKPPAETPDANYPLILTTGRILFHWHTGTMTRRSETLTDQVNEPYIEINHDDASTIGVNNDQYTRVTSRRGEITLRAKVSERIKMGTVFIPFHFAEAAANRLTNNALDPVAKIPEFKVCAVRVEPVK
jgi:predicted molibdopterin-dependent oxidoreductase YjgC